MGIKSSRFCFGNWSSNPIGYKCNFTWSWVPWGKFDRKKGKEKLLKYPNLKHIFLFHDYMNTNEIWSLFLATKYSNSKHLSTTTWIKIKFMNLVIPKKTNIQSKNISITLPFHNYMNKKKCLQLFVASNHSPLLSQNVYIKVQLPLQTKFVILFFFLNIFSLKIESYFFFLHTLNLQLHLAKKMLNSQCWFGTFCNATCHLEQHPCTKTKLQGEKRGSKKQVNPRRRKIHEKNRT
jgi:hypothetical protein